jgi:hypothetical protein
MNLNLWHRVACLALLLPVLAASGCTGTDVLTPTAGNVKIEIDVTDIPADYRFETARFWLQQITIRPADDGANAALGQYSIGLLQNRATINFDLEAPHETSLTLHAGTYRIEEIVINNIRFRDTDPIPEPPPAICEDYIRDYRSYEAGGATMRDLGDTGLFTILGSEENVVRLEFDWTVFTEAILEGWLCLSGFECPPDEDFCVPPRQVPFGEYFDETLFNSYVPDFLTIID